MIYSVFALMLSASALTACSDDEFSGDPAKDWNGTTTFFAPTDAQGFDTYYTPAVGRVGDPMPFYDQKSGEFKVLYLQEFINNMTYRFHPIWAVSTKDGANYESMGELLAYGENDYQQDAALGTGCAFEKDGTYYIYYTGHNGNCKNREVVMRATSTDFKTWTKDELWTLNGPDFGYSGNDFRDPQIFVADDNLYNDWKAEHPNDKRLLKTYFTQLTNPEDDFTYTYYTPYYTPINGKGVDQSYNDAENLEITRNSVDRIEIRYAEVLLTKAEALVQLGRNSEAAGPFNQLRTRAGIASVDVPTLDDIKREWDYEFTYEQFSLLNSYRWKDLISSVRKVSNYKHFADDWASKNTYTSDEAAFFTKVHNHLVAKYNNVKGRNYRQPIPTGLSGEDLGITPQNPGY